MQQNQYKDLWYIVGKVKSDMDIFGTNYDLKFLSWACDGFRDLNMAGVLPTIQTKLLDIDENGYANFPDDYEEYYKIGLYNCGRVINLNANNKIALTTPDKCSCSADHVQGAINRFNDDEFNLWGQGYYGEAWNFLPYFQNGQFVAGMYGRGEGCYHGGYRINEQGRNIKFDFTGLKGVKVIMEYSSNGDIDSGNAYLPAFMASAFVYFVKWKMCENSIKPEYANKTLYFEKKYKKQVRRIVPHVDTLGPEEILDIVRASISQLPKR